MPKLDHSPTKPKLAQSLHDQWLKIFLYLYENDTADHSPSLHSWRGMDTPLFGGLLTCTHIFHTLPQYALQIRARSQLCGMCSSCLHVCVSVSVYACVCMYVGACVCVCVCVPLVNIQGGWTISNRQMFKNPWFSEDKRGVSYCIMHH
jgi:hypothetical protein